MIDWDLAISLGSRLAGEGPVVSRAEAADAVAELRAGAHRSTGLVRDFTGLDAPAGTAPILVVDRPGWVQANAEGFEAASRHMVAKLAAEKPPSRIGQAVGSKVTGAEVGGLLGFLAGKVLGQFDPFHEPHGRLLLVAPNVMHIERELDVDPHDFRLWVCLHEETHRVQFTAVPWMREHLFSEIRAISDAVEPGGFLEGGLERLLEAAKAGRKGGSIVEMFSSPEQREVLDRVTGMMSLLEGHADVVMDDVGPTVIPSVAQIRARFTQRRKGLGTLDRLLRRLLGIEAKMAQYRDGAHFVRSVVDKVGMEEFNAVWAGPENLPAKAELADPESWVRRVLG
ncbi:zinc-dependent metalloprotease [Nocardioides sp. zg-536]|uniref:Zinc-dependent metalloprotease n=2 Tax=Nocardioides faecalis TaxID=2803858 RepID=A0A938YBN9_9ACTN|nr:zinc-dependent metalloprotease [Nocardioides faecalis]MBS4752063.1 zinc-dependent metalloprotease [Nocardioides faecalis]QVI60415.1 zinc-dependent metalloprotease [Nocardioides faecalis]